MEHEITTLNYKKREYKRKYGEFLADTVFGANDGIITTFTVVAGVVGAGLQPFIIIILGIVSILGDGVSMGIGNYLGVKSKRDYEIGQRKKQQNSIESLPNQERQQVEKRLVDYGVAPETAKKASIDISIKKENLLEFMMVNEFGIDHPESATPMIHGLVTFFSFVIAGFVPLFPFLFSLPNAPIISIAASGLALFIIGALRSLLIPANWVKAGFEILAVGGLAGVLAFTIGTLLEHLAGVA